MSYSTYLPCGCFRVCRNRLHARLYLPCGCYRTCGCDTVGDVIATVAAVELVEETVELVEEIVEDFGGGDSW